MIYLTCRYVSTKFDTEAEARYVMEQEVSKHHLRYRKVFEQKQNDMTVVVYQYETLYFEMFILHEKLFVEGDKTL